MFEIGFTTTDGLTKLFASIKTAELSAPSDASAIASFMWYVSPQTKSLYSATKGVVKPLIPKTVVWAELSIQYTL